jgi:hypothetical protein
MNFRKTLLAGALAFGLIGSIIAPSATTAQSIDEDTVYVTVGVGTGGAFDAYFCAPDSYPLTVQSEPQAMAAGNATGQLGLCYVDTVNYRAGFKAQVQSTDFTASNTLFNTPIPAVNLTVTRTFNVGALHWSSENPTTVGHTHPGKIADIGQYQNNAYPPVNGQALPNDWGTNNTLNDARTVNFSWNGIGSVGAQGLFNVNLNIPAGTVPGAYASTLTLTIIPAPEHSNRT